MKKLDLSKKKASEIIDLLQSHSYQSAAEVEKLSLSGAEITQKVIDTMSEKFTHLKKLDISDTKLGDIRFIKSFISLIKLDISNTLVEDVSPISDLSQLVILEASDTRFKSLEPISTLSSLKKLYMERSEVTDLKPLSKCLSLEVIDLYGSLNVNDLTPLSSLESLKALTVKGTNIVNPNQLNYLDNLPNLIKLKVNEDIIFAAKLVLEKISEKKNKYSPTFFSGSHSSSLVLNSTLDQEDKEKKLVEDVVRQDSFKSDLICFLESKGLPMGELNLPQVFKVALFTWEQPSNNSKSKNNSSHPVEAANSTSSSTTSPYSAFPIKC